MTWPVADRTLSLGRCCYLVSLLLASCGGVVVVVTTTTTTPTTPTSTAAAAVLIKGVVVTKPGRNPDRHDVRPTATTTSTTDAREKEDYEDEDIDDLDQTNITRLGMYLGSPCELTCNNKLPHVFCDQISRHCECEKKYPVRLGDEKGCAKPVRLGDQCFYHETCLFTDQHARCRQINHNAICQCEPGYHTVALQRPTKKIFCSEDLVLLTTDVPTLFGVATGLAIFTALICFVLKLFSRARYSRPRHYANANLAPPILFSSETGIPLAVHDGRPSSRASSQRSVGTFTSGFSRRPSSGGSRGVLVPASRAGSRRPSLASIHSSASSSRSYSTRRFERENMQRELRQQQLQDSLRPTSGGGIDPSGDGMIAPPIPSPRTPMSTDELLPSVSELKEECSSLSTSGPSNSNGRSINSGYHGEIGPCTSSDLAQ